MSDFNITDLAKVNLVNHWIDPKRFAKILNQNSSTPSSSNPTNSQSQDSSFQEDSNYTPEVVVHDYPVQAPQEREVFQIVVALDKKFTPYTGVMLFSLARFARTPNVVYKINVFHTNLDQADQDYLIQVLTQAGNPNIEVHFLHLENSDNNFYVHGEVPEIAYYRLFIPEIFTQENYVLYLDSDLVVCRDVYELTQFYKPMQQAHKLVAAVKDLNFEHFVTYNEKVHHKDLANPEFDKYSICGKDYMHDLLGLGDHDSYGNSGVLFFNLEEFRAQNLSRGLINEIFTIAKPHFMDQDILNRFMIQHGGFYFLPDEYNYTYSNDQWGRAILRTNNSQEVAHRTDPNAKIQLYGYTWEEFKARLPNLHMIHHFPASDKPWRTLKSKYSGIIWWACAIIGPFPYDHLNRFAEQSSDWFTQEEVDKIVDLGVNLFKY